MEKHLHNLILTTLIYKTYCKIKRETNSESNLSQVHSQFILVEATTILGATYITHTSSTNRSLKQYEPFGRWNYSEVALVVWLVNNGSRVFLWYWCWTEWKIKNWHVRKKFLAEFTSYDLQIYCVGENTSNKASLYLFHSDGSWRGPFPPSNGASRRRYPSPRVQRPNRSGQSPIFVRIRVYTEQAQRRPLGGFKRQAPQDDDVWPAKGSDADQPQIQDIQV